MPGPPSTDGILETALYVQDVSRSAQFYETIFGYKIISDFRDRGCAIAAGDRRVLLLFQRSGSRNSQPPHGAEGEIHVAFAIASESFADWESWLIENGIAIEQKKRWSGGGRSIFFRDPDRHLLEVATPGTWSIY